MSQLTTPVKPKSQTSTAARVTDTVDVPMLDGKFYEVKLVAGTGASKRGARPLPTVRVQMPNGSTVDINETDFDPGIHRKVAAPAPVAPPVAAFKIPEAVAVVDAPAPEAPEYTEMNAETLIEAVMGIEDRFSLDAIEEYERANKGRKTVLRAIVDRREELA